MKSLMIAASAAAVALPMVAPAPAAAQSRVNREVRECQRELARADSRKEYRKEQRECRREIAQAQRDVRRDRRGDYINLRSRQSYRNYDWNRYEPGYGAYHADRYYRSGSYYSPRQMSWNDRIYRGRDGRYYCRRGDGTTGMIVGASLGALLGNRLNVGGSTTLSTVLGGAAGALLGREIGRGNLRCN